MAGKKKVTTTALLLIAIILQAIGKPLYFVLSHVFIAFYFVLSLIFIFFSKTILLLKNLRLPNLPTLPRIKFKKRTSKVVYPQFKIKLPRLNLPKFVFPDFKLNKLSTKKHYLVKKRYVILFVTIGLLTIGYWLLIRDLPSPKELTTRQIEVSTKIYDRNDTLLYTIYKNKNRSIIKLDNVPQNVILSTIAAEDAEFFSHPGFSIRGMLRALNKNISEGKLQGGSTITQQLVKNALLTSEKTVIRKMRELILSIGVELQYSKNEILEMYLNEVSYGGTIYGVQEASLNYFGKDVTDLSLAEAALLAGLPQSPTKYSPFGNNPDLTFARQREVLHLMKVNKYITQEQESAALKERITFAPNKQNILAPHFVMYVREKLIEEFGEEMVSTGGLTVKTTLDLNIQKIAEQAIQNEISVIKKLNVNNAAAVVIDPKSGEILAMVGSVDYFDTLNDGNVNVTTRLRQPGSSIKVITYALGLQNKLTLSSIVDDTPIAFRVQGQKDYLPKNYDGTYKGRITIRQALAQSRNIPAVKILASLGVDKMIGLGERMGITTWQDKSRFGLSLTLGGGETKLLDLATVYSVIANQGIRNNLVEITEVRNNNGKIIKSAVKNYEQVLDPRIAYLLIDVLKDNVSRSAAFGINSKLVIANHPEVAVKTGTSNDLKDNLTIGFNKDYLTAVWVGNNDGSSMSRIASGITGAAPIWNRIMTILLQGNDSTDWPIPSGLVQKECYGRMEWYLVENQMNCPKIIEPAASITQD